jgi:SpoVK/Ycf46/Vps4 family AAA+-type ATPase
LKKQTVQFMITETNNRTLEYDLWTFIKAKYSLNSLFFVLVLHPLLRQRLQLVPYKDTVEIMDCKMIDIERQRARTKQAVDQGDIRFHFRPVSILYRQTGQAWRYPFPSQLRHDQSLDSNQESSRHVDLNALGNLNNLPMLSGALLALPLVDSESPSIVLECFVQSIREKKNTTSHLDDSHFLLLLKDLDHLLSYNDISNFIDHSRICKTSRLYIEQDILLVNPLPTPSASLPESIIPRSQTSIKADAILCGEKGSGKTHTALFIAALHHLLIKRGIVYLDCKVMKETPGMRMNDLLQEITKTFRDALSWRHSVIVLDNLDEIAPHYSSNTISDDSSKSQQVDPAAAGQSRLVSDHLTYLLREYKAQGYDLVTIVTCRTGGVSLLLLQELDLVEPTMLPIADSVFRSSLFMKHLQATCPTQIWDDASHWSAEIARKTDGFRPQDYRRLALAVNDKMQKKDDVPTRMNDILDECIAEYTPLSRLRSQASWPSSRIKWEAVGGLFDVKKKLQSTVARPMKDRAIYSKAQVSLSKGILLFGPPGKLCHACSIFFFFALSDVFICNQDVARRILYPL